MTNYKYTIKDSEHLMKARQQIFTWEDQVKRLRAEQEKKTQELINDCRLWEASQLDDEYRKKCFNLDRKISNLKSACIKFISYNRELFQ